MPCTCPRRRRSTCPRYSSGSTHCRRASEPAGAEVAVREGSRNLLTHPGHGEPDDLTQIKGVPKVLERKLHKMGVFYFWQIAEWSPDDVK